MIIVIWTDGSRTTGDTWEEVEEAIRASQWVPYKSRRAFRQDMRHRAKVWGGTAPPALGRVTSEKFLRALEAAGLCRIVTTEGEQ